MAHAERARAARPGARASSAHVLPPDFGADHDHKPAKTIVGIALLIVLGVLFYELGGKPAVHSSAFSAQQTIASSSH